MKQTKASLAYVSIPSISRATDSPEEALKKTLDAAAALGCGLNTYANGSLDGLVTCLQRVDVKTLLNATAFSVYLTHLIFYPNHGTELIPKRSGSLSRDARVTGKDLLLGNTATEGEYLSRLLSNTHPTSLFGVRFRGALTLTLT